MERDSAHRSAMLAQYLNNPILTCIMFNHGYSSAINVIGNSGNMMDFSCTWNENKKNANALTANACRNRTGVGDVKHSTMHDGRNATKVDTVLRTTMSHSTWSINAPAAVALA
jgi:hypothetical protein